MMKIPDLISVSACAQCSHLKEPDKQQKLAAMVWAIYGGNIVKIALTMF
ncbi:MAG: hypothetical protein L3J98_03845 [Gammaproteobacteria bacterium]|nr:hypothetical protein [Gammaproteobacteria bacterium]